MINKKSFQYQVRIPSYCAEPGEDKREETTRANIERPAEGEHHLSQPVSSTSTPDAIHGLGYGPCHQEQRG